MLLGDPAIGGRYSVMSNFGMVAAAILGLDIHKLLETTKVMVRACGASAPPRANPGVYLGIVLGLAARQGHDKVTFIASPPIAPLGAWLEQLLAESTGKHGKGLIPVDAEPLGDVASTMATTRVFVHLLDARAPRPMARDRSDRGSSKRRAIRSFTSTLASPATLSQEFFRWEVATAIAGAMLGIDPFDQPDVEASKVKARELTDAFEKNGKEAESPPLYASDGMSVHADGHNAQALAVDHPSLKAFLEAHFARAGKSDYIGLLAWLDRNQTHTEALQAMRRDIRDLLKTATALGFGPRFLHSTGQAYKGGPNSGVFLEITAKPVRDLPIPGRKISFGQVETAQALGDMSVLEERGRRVLRIDLGEDIEGGLGRLGQAVKSALS